MYNIIKNVLIKTHFVTVFLIKYFVAHNSLLSPTHTSSTKIVNVHQELDLHTAWQVYAMECICVDKIVLIALLVYKQF